MLKDPKTFLVPKLRFPEFRNEPPWKTRKLGKLFRQREETGRDDLRLLSLTDKEGIIPQEESNRKNNASVDRSKYLRVARGDIVYNTMRMWEGRSALATLEGIVSPAYTVCEPCEETNSLFFAHYFKTSQLVAQFARYSQGLVKDTLNLKFEAFARILAPTPSPAEQQKIAECLSTLDELIEAESRKLDALKDHKKGLMQQLFPREGETRPRLRFPEFQDAPEWENKKIGDICRSFSGGTPDTSRKEFYGGTIPFIRSAELGKRSTELSLTELGLKNSAAKLVAKGDVLVALYGANSGDIAIAQLDGAINQAILCLRPYEDDGPFIYHYLSHKKDWLVATYIQGGQGNLSGEIVKSIELRFPEPVEQHRIATCLSSLEDLIAAQSDKLEALRTHKRGLMQQLFPNPSEFES